MNKILAHLVYLYGDQEGRATYDRLVRLIDRYRSRIASPMETTISERDAILITYGDQVQQTGITPLRALAEFCDEVLSGVVSAIHILPFFPFSSDDGFSVIDYKQVNPALGDWDDIFRMGKRFRLMFDAVINHISAQSAWFQGFLQDQPAYRDYFIVVEGQPDLSQVVRPRALPLLSSVSTSSGEKSVWTTFSTDQIDLNYQNPRVLLEIVDTLLFYIEKGAEFIRLDAIAYLWKEIGTSCIHLPQTHRVVQLFHSILDIMAPQVQIITETNVPHDENISYFGDGENEAQMVYNFALPPLVLHTMQTGDARAISRWAAGLKLPSNQVTFFNFLASHDGIGVTPAKGLISPEEINMLVERALAHGGLVSYRSNPDGSQSPYELNINYFDALSDPKGGELLQKQVKRFIAAHAIMFSLVGVPGIYFHSIFGSRGWLEGVAITGRNRTINRQKLDLTELKAGLSDPGSTRSMVNEGLARLLKARAAHPDFHPYGPQVILNLDARIFCVLRTSPDGRSRVVCLQNVSDQVVQVGLPLEGLAFDPTSLPIDIITGKRVELNSAGRLSLQPYQVLWMADI